MRSKSGGRLFSLMKLKVACTLMLVCLLAACQTGTLAPTALQPSTSAPATPPPATSIGTGSLVLRLATTTSTADTALLNAILPDFNTKYGARSDAVAVGTRQPLTIS